MAQEEIMGMYELLDALEEALQASDPSKREQLAKTIDAYHDDFPEDFHWALGAQSPVLLHHLRSQKTWLAARARSQSRAV